MGQVYRARDPRLGRVVAVKVLPTSFSADAKRLRRFEREARAAGMLNHPNVLAVYDVGTDEGSPYLVTELLEGETLRARLSAGALPLSKVFDYAVQISLGLAAANEKSIVHRDLKPENLFLTRDGRVKILDRPRQARVSGKRRPDRCTHHSSGHGPWSRVGNGRLHVAGAGSGPGGGRALRPLRRGSDRLRNAHGPAGLSARHQGRDDERHPVRGS